jgi:hypothetical protein
MHLCSFIRMWDEEMLEASCAWEDGVCNLMKELIEYVTL